MNGLRCNLIEGSKGVKRSFVVIWITIWPRWRFDDCLWIFCGKGVSLDGRPLNCESRQYGGNELLCWRSALSGSSCLEIKSSRWTGLYLFCPHIISSISSLTQGELNNLYVTLIGIHLILSYHQCHHCNRTHQTSSFPLNSTHLECCQFDPHGSISSYTHWQFKQIHMYIK